MKAGVTVSLVLLLVACADPARFTANFTTAASQNLVVGERGQLVVQLTNTGPAISHLGLVFRTADKWYEHHAIVELGGCIVNADASAFDCGDVGAGETESFTFVGTAKDAGTFHYELALRQLVRPFDYVNNSRDGAEVQTWDETVTKP